MLRDHALLERNIDLIVDVLLCIAMDVHIITGEE
jgi:hypothetical protein